MLERNLKHGIIILTIILVFIPSSIEIRAKLTSFTQEEEFNLNQLLPSPSTRTTQISSNSMQQQDEVIKYLIDSWDVSEILEDDLTSTVEIICQAVTALPSVQISSQIRNEILSEFDLILTMGLTNSKETLNKTIEGLFYILKNGDRNVSTNMNLWITKALLTLEPSRNLSSIEMANDIMQALELNVRGQSPGFYLHSSILLDPIDLPIPGSISPIVILQDQLMAMTIYQQLSYKIYDDTIFEIFDRISHLENLTMNDKDGFLDFNLSYNLELDFGFLHAERDQVREKFHYQNNRSCFYFRDGLYLLEYFFNQIKDYSTEADREIYDSYFFSPLLANLYHDDLVSLLTDLQVLFRYEDIFYYDKMSTYNFDTALPIYPSDRIYMSHQFTFIGLLSRMANWYSSSTLSTDFQAFGKQLQRLAIFLWDNLTIEAYSTSTGGQAANSVNSSSGYFFAYYSISLGLYLFDNTSQGSLLKANIFALNGLGTVFPFQLLLEYDTPITVRDNQSIFIQVIPLTNVSSSGLYVNSKLLLSVPAESLNTIIATPTITAEANYSTRYNFSISLEGHIAFSIHLSHQGVEFFNLEASYLALRSLMMVVLVDPVTPTQGDQITIHFEVRDEIGLLRNNIFYFAIIDSESLDKPLYLSNQSLYTLTEENPITLNSSQTKNDLYCYFLVHKDNYYPAETNLTIHFQTKLNFLVEWLVWLILESDMGAWIGTIAALSALLWGLYARFINRLLRRVKTCQYCGSSWSTKYPACAHCGRVLNPKKIKKDSPLAKELEKDQEEIISETEI
ncbi:MAG: hypothetical protein ACW991_03020 [Candidatus Hodarchaeales archaeon]|jgi:hypothetical protein